MNAQAKALDDLQRLGLFDRDYYEAAYLEAMRPGEGAFEHYMREGDARGFRPCARFDPIIYRIRHPEAAGQNALLHYLGTRPAPEALTLRLRKFLQGLPAIWTGRPRPPSQEWPNLQPYRRASRLYPDLRIDLPAAPAEDKQTGAMATECKFTFAVNATQYCMETPNPSYFLDRIAANEPFTFARLPHGFWDSLAAVDDMTEQVEVRHAQMLTREHSRRLAIRLLKEQIPHNGVYEENVLDEVLASIPRHQGKPGYFQAVEFKGPPTRDEQEFETDRRDRTFQIRLSQFQRQFTGGGAFFDAALWKRWLITGALRDLPDLCRRHPVILVGPESLHGIQRAWKLDRFFPILIPRANTQRRRHALLARICSDIDACARAGSAAGNAPIVLFQCGGSFAYWLAARLFDRNPRCFLIDMGQALNAWCYDVEINTMYTWNRNYLRTIIRNNGLESYYRDVMGPGYEELLKKFPEPSSGRGH